MNWLFGFLAGIAIMCFGTIFTVNWICDYQGYINWSTDTRLKCVPVEIVEIK